MRRRGASQRPSRPEWSIWAEREIPVPRRRATKLTEGDCPAIELAHRSRGTVSWGLVACFTLAFCACHTVTRPVPPSQPEALRAARPERNDWQNDMGLMQFEAD